MDNGQEGILCQCKSLCSRKAVSASKEYKSSRPGASCNFITREEVERNKDNRTYLKISIRKFALSKAAQGVVRSSREGKWESEGDVEVEVVFRQRIFEN